MLTAEPNSGPGRKKWETLGGSLHGVRCRTSLSETALRATSTKWIWQRRQDCSPPLVPVLIADSHRLGKRPGHSFLPCGHDVGVGIERGQDAGLPHPSRNHQTFCFCCRARLAWKCLRPWKLIRAPLGVFPAAALRRMVSYRPHFRRVVRTRPLREKKDLLCLLMAGLG